MTLNDLSSNIYVLNLKKRTDRKEHIINELAKINCDSYTLFESVDGQTINNPTNLRTGMFGLLMSYIKLFEDWSNKNADNILIIEDDCIFLDNFNTELEKYINNVPNDWEMLYFGGNHNYHIGCKTEKINNYCVKLNNTYSAHCVLLKNYVFEDLISNLKHMDIENDVMLAKLQKKYNSYSPINTLTKQLNNYSNIEEKFTNSDSIIL